MMLEPGWLQKIADALALDTSLKYFCEIAKSHMSDNFEFRTLGTGKILYI